MPDVREVYEMVTRQKTQAPGALERQQRRQVRTARNRKIGAFAVSAAFVIVAAVLVLTVTGAPDTGERDTKPADTGPAVQGPMDLYALDLATGELTGIPGPDLGSTSGIDVSEDGSMIAYVANGARDQEVVHIANIDGTNIRVFDETSVAGEAIVEPVAPRWSPDGSQIVYQATTGGTDVGDIFVLDVATGRTRHVLEAPTRSDFYYMSPDFSADGGSIVFMMPFGTEAWHVASVPVTGGKPEILVRNAGFPDVSPDGANITYTGGDWTGVWVSNADGSDPRRLVEGTFAQPRWSPDGTKIAVSDVANDDTLVVDVRTGEATTVFAVARTPEWVDDDTLIWSNS